MNILNLNILLLQSINEYRNCTVSNTKFTVPYAVNLFSGNVSNLLHQAGCDDEVVKKVNDLYKSKAIPYGWGRGKGSAEEIRNSVITLAQIHGYTLKNSSSEGIRAFMHLFGIGIDCSGFVFNILYKVFAVENLADQFIQSLNWQDLQKTGADYANVNVFINKASRVIRADEVRPLDLFLIRDEEGYSHIGVIAEEGSNLYIFQSNINCSPDGIHSSLYSIIGGKPVFDFQPTIGVDWNELFNLGKLEFRRLEVLV